MTVIVRAVRTCLACPSQWDAWDEQGRYWYLRYRGGRGTAVQQPGADPATWADKPPELSFAHGDSLDGSIDLADFARLAGMELRIP